jgi:hypothetical protein
MEKKNNMENKLGAVKPAKFKVGKKKLKNIKMYEELGPDVSERSAAHHSPAQAVEDIFHASNLINYLWDEGYIDDNLKPKGDVDLVDVNDALFDDFGEKQPLSAEEFNDLPGMLRKVMSKFK